MGEERNGSKWQLAFWMMTGVCFAGMIFIGTNVIANDKSMRQEYKTADTEIIIRVERRFEALEKKIDENYKDFIRELRKT